MKSCLIYLIGLSSMSCCAVHATSFGIRLAGDFAIIDQKPAICLPSNASDDFPIGSVSVSQSYTRNSPSWGFSKAEDQAPMMLARGSCMKFGDVPPNYSLDGFGTQPRLEKLEIDRTYVFRVSHAWRPTDSYIVVFCVNKPGIKPAYSAYEPLSKGSRVVPACDARRNSMTVP